MAARVYYQQLAVSQKRTAECGLHSGPSLRSAEIGPDYTVRRLAPASCPRLMSVAVRWVT